MRSDARFARLDADPSRDHVALRWAHGQGADACATEAELADDVSARLGRRLQDMSIPLQIDVIVERTATRWTARIDTCDAFGGLLGERAMTSDEAACQSLDSAVGLTIALAINPGLGPSPPAAPPADKRAQETASAPRPRDAAEEPSLRRAADERRAAARAELAIGVSPTLVREVQPDVHLDVDARLTPAVRWTAGVMYVPERRSNAASADLGFALTAFHLQESLARLEARERHLARTRARTEAVGRGLP